MAVSVHAKHVRWDIEAIAPPPPLWLIVFRALLYLIYVMFYVAIAAGYYLLYSMWLYVIDDYTCKATTQIKLHIKH